MSIFTGALISLQSLLYSRRFSFYLVAFFRVAFYPVAFFPVAFYPGFPDRETLILFHWLYTDCTLAEIVI